MHEFQRQQHDSRKWLTTSTNNTKLPMAMWIFKKDLLSIWFASSMDRPGNLIPISTPINYPLLFFYMIFLINYNILSPNTNYSNARSNEVKRIIKDNL